MINKKDITGIDEGTVEMLCAYAWPGNVRELRNVIERATILCQYGNISGRHLLLPTGRSRDCEDSTMTLAELEQVHIKRVLQMTEGNKTRAAQVLGVARSTLNEKLKQFNL
jgi:DNA-binding NtrC family response regulator